MTEAEVREALAGRVGRDHAGREVRKRVCPVQGGLDDRGIPVRRIPAVLARHPRAVPGVVPGPRCGCRSTRADDRYTDRLLRRAGRAGNEAHMEGWHGRGRARHRQTLDRNSCGFAGTPLARRRRDACPRSSGSISARRDSGGVRRLPDRPPRVIPDRRERSSCPRSSRHVGRARCRRSGQNVCLHRSPDPPSSRPSGCSGGPTMTRRPSSRTCPSRCFPGRRRLGCSSAIVKIDPAGGLGDRAQGAQGAGGCALRRAGPASRDHRAGYFDESQRQATREAGRIAGLEVVRLRTSRLRRPSPTGFERRRNRVVAVYDLGGGTFDISSSGRGRSLRGARDERAYPTRGRRLRPGARGVPARGYPCEPWRGPGRGPSGDAAAPAGRGGREGRALASAPDHRPDILRQLRIPPGDPRAELEDRIDPLVEGTSSDARWRCETPGWPPPTSTSSCWWEDRPGCPWYAGARRICSVARRTTTSIRTRWWRWARRSRRTSWRGACGHAPPGRDAARARDRDPRRPRRWVIPRNTTIPTRAEETFTTAVDGQTTIALHVVQGQGELAEECRSLARFELRGIPPMPAGVPEIRVTFWIDADGLLRVEATERHAPRRRRSSANQPMGPHEAEITRILASVRPEGEIECS